MRCLCCSRDRAVADGWRIVGVAFAADALALGGRSLFSVVMLEFEREFGWDRRTSSWLMATVHACNGIATPAAGG